MDAIVDVAVAVEAASAGSAQGVVEAISGNGANSRLVIDSTDVDVAEAVEASSSGSAEGAVEASVLGNLDSTEIDVAEAVQAASAGSAGGAVEASVVGGIENADGVDEGSGYMVGLNWADMYRPDDKIGVALVEASASVIMRIGSTDAAWFSSKPKPEIRLAKASNTKMELGSSFAIP